VSAPAAALTAEQAMLGPSVLLLPGILANSAADRVGVPTLLLLRRPQPGRTAADRAATR
jgi:hypothetical protein